MGLEATNQVDAIGIDTETGKVVLNILDSLDWNDPYEHLIALQAKLNAYFDFVEEGQMQETYPASRDRDILIRIITKHPLHPLGSELIEIAENAIRDLNIEIRADMI